LYIATKAIRASELTDGFMQHTVLRSSAPEVILHIPNHQIPEPQRAPAGVVFHVGRCGSTALAQALKGKTGLTVYGEPLPFNELLISSASAGTERLVWALRNLAGAYAAHADGRYVLKLSSWNVLYCKLLSDAFPETPWIFMMRDPLEVGAAVLSEPPPWFQGVDGAAKTIGAIVDPKAEACHREDFFARLFCSYCEAVLTLPPRLGRLANYDSLGVELVERALRHFGVEQIGQDERESILSSLRRNTKQPWGRPGSFVGDVREKRGVASPELAQAVQQAIPGRLSLLAKQLSPL
jgi:hypothetical protein